MNQKQFEEKYKQLISHAPLEDIINLFNEKKNNYSENKFSLWIQKIKDKFSKDKYAQFIELGYSQFHTFDFTKNFFDIALQHERADMIEYMFEKDYINSMGESFYLNQIVSSEKVLSNILAKPEIEEKITSYEYGQMLHRSVMYKKPDSFDIICKIGLEKVKQIKKEKQTEILLACAKYNAPEMLEKLLHMKEPFVFDVEDKEEDPYGVIHTKENLLILAAKSHNIDMISYLLTSEQLGKNADLAESFWWIERLHNAQQLMQDIIFEIKAPLTENLEKVLENSEYLELFKKREFMLKIAEKLPPKNIKIKTRKI